MLDLPHITASAFASTPTHFFFTVFIFYFLLFFTLGLLFWLRIYIHVEVPLFSASCLVPRAVYGSVKEHRIGSSLVLGVCVYAERIHIRIGEHLSLRLRLRLSLRLR